MTTSKNGLLSNALNTRLSVDLDRRLRERALKERRAVAQLVRVLLEDALDRADAAEAQDNSRQLAG